MLKNLLYLSIFTTFVVIVWIGLSVYHNYTTSTLSSATQIQIEQIDPSFNIQAVEKIKKRTQIRADLQDSTFQDVASNEGTNSAEVLALPTITPLENTQISPPLEDGSEIGL